MRSVYILVWIQLLTRELNVLCVLMRWGNLLWLEKSPSVVLGEGIISFWLNGSCGRSSWHFVSTLYRFLSNTDTPGFVLFGDFTCIGAVNSCSHTHKPLVKSPKLPPPPLPILNNWLLTLSRSRKLWDNIPALLAVHYIWKKQEEIQWKKNTHEKKKQKKNVWDEKGPKSAKSQYAWVTDGRCPRPGDKSKPKAPAADQHRGHAGLWGGAGHGEFLEVLNMTPGLTKRAGPRGSLASPLFSSGTKKENFLRPQPRSSSEAAAQHFTPLWITIMRYLHTNRAFELYDCLFIILPFYSIMVVDSYWTPF